MSSGFRFKEFSVHHDRCLMKVGTDGVLLGALAEPGRAVRILDIGTGSGLIALMMAQKSTARITGIDIDAASIAQATQNAAASPWSTRLHMQHISLQEYADQRTEEVDFIISNPPFFSRSLSSPFPQRNLAKHDETLSLDVLMQASSRLLCPGGTAWFILPSDQATRALNIAKSAGLQRVREISVIPKEGKPAHRLVMQFLKGVEGSSCPGHIVIRDRQGNYTEAYRKACAPFYLDPEGTDL